MQLDVNVLRSPFRLTHEFDETLQACAFDQILNEQS
jgi:hypothetical protein